MRIGAILLAIMTGIALMSDHDMKFLIALIALFVSLVFLYGAEGESDA